MQANWVDLVIVGLLVYFGYQGYGGFFLAEVFDLAGLILALIFSLRFYNLAAKQLETTLSLPHSLANVFGFIGAWFLTETLLFILARSMLPKLVRRINFPQERWLSIIPSLVRGLVFIAIFLVLTGTFPIQPKVKKAINNSRLGSAILGKTYQLEAPLKNVFGGLSQDTLTFLTIKPQSDEKVNIGFQTNKFFFDEQLESQMIELVNKERFKKGVPELKFNTSLREVGRGHSADMFKRGYFSHYSPEGENVAKRAEKVGVDYLVIGENLAFAPTLELAHQGLMNSEGHRANILSQEYHQIGVGVAHSDDYGLMITQVFRN